MYFHCVTVMTIDKILRCYWLHYCPTQGPTTDKITNKTNVTKFFDLGDITVGLAWIYNCEPRHATPRQSPIAWYVILGWLTLRSKSSQSLYKIATKDRKPRYGGSDLKLVVSSLSAANGRDRPKPVMIRRTIEHTSRQRKTSPKPILSIRFQPQD